MQQNTAHNTAHSIYLICFNLQEKMIFFLESSFKLASGEHFGFCQQCLIIVYVFLTQLLLTHNCIIYSKTFNNCDIRRTGLQFPLSGLSMFFENRCRFFAHAGQYIGNSIEYCLGCHSR